MNVLELKVSLPWSIAGRDCASTPPGWVHVMATAALVHVGFSDCRGQADGMVKPGTSDNNFPAGVRECIALYDWL